MGLPQLKKRGHVERSHPLSQFLSPGLCQNPKVQFGKPWDSSLSEAFINEGFYLTSGKAKLRTQNHIQSRNAGIKYKATIRMVS